jgi:putative restriction endonuclease
MTQLALQPCGSRLPLEHFGNTVHRTVNILQYDDVLSQDDFNELMRVVPSGLIEFWGVVPGVKSSTYERMQIGDVAIFTGHNIAFYTGTVLAKLDNSEFARRLWGEDAKRRVWTHMYAIGSSRFVNIPVPKINSAIGYVENYAIRGYTVLSDERSSRALSLIQTASTQFPPDWMAVTQVTAILAAEGDNYGEVAGYLEGSSFKDRKAVRAAGLHRHLMAGISNPPGKPAEAIVVSGGYEDDEDYGDVIVYTGQGGRATARTPAKDQVLSKGNLALMMSRDQGVPVRVIRGFGGDKLQSPAEGYRYDGLYRVENGWIEDSRKGCKVYRFRLIKLPNEDQVTWSEPDNDNKSHGAKPMGTDKPSKEHTKSTLRVIRDTKITRWVKSVHDFTCQVCSTRLETPVSAYAEGAHIKPIGTPHNGSDTVENMLCLCPNCHTLFDRGGLSIDPETFDVLSPITGKKISSLRRAPEHPVDLDAIRYHREHISYFECPNES